jgi:hypothetical protein
VELTLAVFCCDSGPLVREGIGLVGCPLRMRQVGRFVVPALFVVLSCFVSFLWLYPKNETRFLIPFFGGRTACMGNIPKER